jgi:hypothetical protein
MNKKDFDALKKRMEADAKQHFIGIDFRLDDTPTGKQITMHPYRAPDENGQSPGARGSWSKEVVYPADEPNLENQLRDAIKAAAQELYPNKP